jgi:hypothetical protein
MALGSPAPTRTTTSRLDPAMVTRAFYLPLAVLVTFTLVVQFFVSLTNDTPPSTATRLIRLFSFFTVQSNALVCATTWGLVLRPRRTGLLWRVLWINAVIGISVTGVVFSAVLAGNQHLTGWAAFCNTVFHYIVPIAAFVGWLVVGPRGRLDRQAVGLSFIWPLGWYAYTLIHGAISHWYPYPFVDVTLHGYGRVILNGLAVMVLLIILLALMWLVDGRAPSLSGPPRRPQPGSERLPDHVA